MKVQLDVTTTAKGRHSNAAICILPQFILEAASSFTSTIRAVSRKKSKVLTPLAATNTAATSLAACTAQYSGPREKDRTAPVCFACMMVACAPQLYKTLCCCCCCCAILSCVHFFIRVHEKGPVVCMSTTHNLISTNVPHDYWSLLLGTCTRGVVHTLSGERRTNVREGSCLQPREVSCT